MRIGLIWAEAHGGAIGRDGVMPWHLPEDLAHFKRSTLGAPVIMGRRTWESLPERFRPLPGRENLVVSSQSGYQAEGASVLASLEDAVAQLQDRGASIAWIMGGGQLYREALPFADELIITTIDLDVPNADTFAPESREGFELVDPGTSHTAVNGLKYRFERWVRHSQIP